MAPDSDRRVCAFLAATLALWEIDGHVDALTSPGVASIRVNGSGERIVLERAPPGDPFRWYLRRVSAASVGDADRSAPARPCGSLTGVLSGLRRMLGVESGITLRIARGP
jgi:hypothetical protein